MYSDSLAAFYWIYFRNFLPKIKPKKLPPKSARATTFIFATLSRKYSAHKKIKNGSIRHDLIVQTCPYSLGDFDCILQALLWKLKSTFSNERKSEYLVSASLVKSIHVYAWHQITHIWLSDLLRTCVLPSSVRNKIQLFLREVFVFKKT